MTDPNNICEQCGEPFFPGQRYYAAPKKEHVMCRKARDLGMELGAAYYKAYLLALELELRETESRKIIAPLLHKAKGDYNKWAHGPGKSKGLTFTEAMEALRKMKS